MAHVEANGRGARQVADGALDFRLGTRLTGREDVLGAIGPPTNATRGSWPYGWERSDATRRTGREDVLKIETEVPLRFKAPL